jgi:hypothetical protein
MIRRLSKAVPVSLSKIYHLSSVPSRTFPYFKVIYAKKKKREKKTSKMAFVYHYDTLPSETSYIRLMILQPDTFNSQCLPSHTSTFHGTATHEEGDEECVLWIDAICINQSDELERSVQVGYMGEIYESARRVVVWVGEADELGKSDRAMEFLGDIETIFYSWDGWKQNMEALNELLSRPWFSRTWVVQEV